MNYLINIRERPPIDQYFMNVADVIATRATCLHHNVGAVLVQDRHIIATGYNGAPSGALHCLDIGCSRQNIESGTRHELCRAVHAEQNTIAQAALHGIKTAGATLYCTHWPCSLCAKLIVNAGIKRIVYRNNYPDPLSEEILMSAGIQIQQVQL